MKLDPIKSIISFAIAGLISYAFYEFAVSEQIMLLTTGSFILLATSLLFSVAVNFNENRTTVNNRVVSVLSFFVFLVLNTFFSSFNFSQPQYIISNGIILLIYVLMLYAIHKASLS